MKHLKLIVIAILLLTTFSCNKDDDSGQEEENIRELVENFVTADLISNLQQLVYTFRDGNEQPDISGTFHYSTHILKASNIEDDSPVGSAFATSTFTFSNLNPENRSFDFVGIDSTGSNFGNVTDTFYSGTGSNFSA